MFVLVQLHMLAPEESKNIDQRSASRTVLVSMVSVRDIHIVAIVLHSQVHLRK